MIKNLLLGLGAASIALMGAASADPLPDPALSFGITATGSYTVDTGNIESGTSTMTIPAAETVSDTSTPTTAAEAGISDSTPVTYSTLTFNTVVGPDAFTLTAGDLIFSFLTVATAIDIPTGASSNGSISEEFNGSVTSDTSGFGFLGQTVDLSRTCTQSDAGASITCSSSLQTPAPPASVPEPSTLALFGAGLVAFGFYRRRQAR